MTSSHISSPGAGEAPDRPAAPLAIVVLVGAAIILAYIGFSWATLPQQTPPGVSILTINKGIFDTVVRTLSERWTRLLWPLEYEPGGIYWQPATIYATYFGQVWFGPLGNYLFFSCLFIATAFGLGFAVTRSLTFAATLGFCFAFGTQLNYAYTYGSLIPLYLVLTYAAINLAVAVMLVEGRLGIWFWRAGFVASLGVLALASEWWLSYASALGIAAMFGLLWARHHRRAAVMRACVFILAVLAVVAILYLRIRLRFPGQFFRHGAEEELLLTYSSPVLMAEDLIVNFFTFLYETLDNYLPSFVSSSNALTYLGPGAIVTGQHGYHPAKQGLAVMSHVFLWRFYAGAAVAAFVYFLGRTVRHAWRDPSRPAGIIAALMMMMMAGFTTHLLIKMRPYNSVPGLSYKVLFSVSAWTVLIAYLVMLARQHLRSAAYRSVLALVWLSVSAAALTRPGMQAQLLAQVGLVGLRDPIGQLVPGLRAPAAGAPGKPDGGAAEDQPKP